MGDASAVLADTSGLYALLDADDGRHAEAAAAWRRLLEGGCSIVVHVFVLLETWALIQSRLGMAAVQTFHRDHLPLLSLRPVSDALLARGMARCLGSNLRDQSLCDCVSFELAAQAGITRAFAFDAHFEEAGLSLPRSPGWPG